MWSRAPSNVVTGCAMFAMAITTLSALYFPLGMGSISFQVAVFVWIYIIAWALIQDIVKVATYTALHYFEAIEDETAFVEADFKRSNFRRQSSL